MNAILKVLVCALALFIATPATYAQKTEKQLKKELKKKADKDSRKTAKTLKKEGWKVMPGKLPLEKQIQESRYAELDVNESGDKRFFTGTHQAIGGNYSAAKQIADSRARTELAQNIHTAIAKKIEDQVSNNNYGDEDIQLIDEYVSANKTIISTQLSGVVPVLEIYREVNNNQYEVMEMVKIDADKAMRIARQGLYNDLKQKSNKLADDLDKVLTY